MSIVRHGKSGGGDISIPLSPSPSMGEALSLLLMFTLFSEISIRNGLRMETTSCGRGCKGRDLGYGEACGPVKITLADLLVCKQSRTAASVVIDACGFRAHDNWDYLLQEEKEPLEEEQL